MIETKRLLQEFFAGIKALTPLWVYGICAPIYHSKLALLGALIYRFPSRKIFVVAVTGTKGKTTTVELINSILEEAGYTTALAGTIRLKIGSDSHQNLFKMTMPGRFFLQKFLRRAVDEHCDYAIIEMTSEGSKQFRHALIYLDALIFTNISPEHIESHGSYEKYLVAKLKLGKSLGKKIKKQTAVIANTDSGEADKFLALKADKKIPFSLKDALPYTVGEKESVLTFGGQTIRTKLRGEFNIANIVAAATFARSRGIESEVIRRGIEKLERVRGRMERVIFENKIGKEFGDFEIIVDYAHTADSLTKAYEALADKPKICVFGGTGGGRDKWKRPIMGSLSVEYCKTIILTTDDPYDEPPLEICYDIQRGINAANKDRVANGKSPIPAYVIVDRREAIKKAIGVAKKGDTIILAGKGADPYIMGKNNEKIPWDDVTVAREELEKYLTKY